MKRRYQNERRGRAQNVCCRKEIVVTTLFFFMIYNFGAGSVRVQRKREREAEKQDYLPDKSSPAL